MFMRLYNLCTKKGGMLGEMGSWENVDWIWDFGWKHELRANEKIWEDELLFFFFFCRDSP